MPEITIKEFNPEMTDDTADLLARAFVTNPLNIAAFGVDQVSANRAFFRGGLRVMRGRKLVAMDEARLVGFIHWVTSPGCQFSGPEKLAMLPRMIQEFGPQRSLRISSTRNSELPDAKACAPLVFPFVGFFVPLADVAKGGDGAKSAFRQFFFVRCPNPRDPFVDPSEPKPGSPTNNPISKNKNDNES